MKKFLTLFISILFLFSTLSIEIPAFAKDNANIILNVMRNYNYSKVVLDKVNEEREKIGAEKLVMNNTLLECAMQRAGEIATYFSHTRPNGTSFSVLNDLYVSENIAAGFGNPVSVMNGWMNSSGHRANILKSSHKSIGVGCVFHNGSWYWVQAFGTNESQETLKTGTQYVDQKIDILPENISLCCNRIEVDYTDPDIYQEIDVESINQIFEYSKYPEGFKPLVEGANIGKCNGSPYAGFYNVSSESLVYSSSNDNVFNVDENGIVHIIETGSAVFKAQLKENPEIFIEKIINVFKDHSYDQIIVTEPTCTSYGYTTYTCKCGDSFVDDYVDATGHMYKAKTAKATISKNGSVVTKCTVCSAVKSKATIYYPKTIKLSKTSYTYNGKTQTPSVTVKDSKGKTLKKNTDYTVTFAKGRKNVGKYAVKITFKGKYSGSKTLYYTIKPKATSISKLTAGKKKFTIKWKKQTSQTTGYQIQYSTNKNFKSAKTVTVSKNKTTSKSITKLKAKKKYYVRIRTYKTVGKTKYYSSWSKAKAVTTKK